MWRQTGPAVPASVSPTPLLYIAPQAPQAPHVTVYISAYLVGRATRPALSRDILLFVITSANVDKDLYWSQKISTSNQYFKIYFIYIPKSTIETRETHSLSVILWREIVNLSINKYYEWYLLALLIKLLSITLCYLIQI